MECCGQKIEQNFCPVCGEPVVETSLVALRQHCLRQARKLESGAGRAGESKRKRLVEKWRMYAVELDRAIEVLDDDGWSDAP